MANQYTKYPPKYPMAIGDAWLGDGGRWPLRQIVEMDEETVKLDIKTGRTVTLSHHAFREWARERNARVVEL